MLIDKYYLQILQISIWVVNLYLITVGERGGLALKEGVGVGG